MRLLLALLLLLSAPLARALPETALFHSFGPAQGLPSSQVSALALDQDGYLWVGTRDGLARFDGERFRLWQQAPEDPGSLPGNAVQSLLVDAQNRLWVGTEGAGLAMLDARRERFFRFAFDADAGGGARDVWAIAQTPDGAIWYGGFDSGLFRLDPESNRIGRHLADPDRPDALPGDDVLALVVDAQGRLWVGTTEGLARLEDDGFFVLPELDGRLIVRLRAEAEGGLLVGTGSGPMRIDAEGALHALAVAEGELPRLPVTSLQRDTQNTLWFGTARGLFQLDGERLAHHISNRRRPFTLGAHAVLDLLLDHEGGLWIATQGGGLAHLPREWRAFSVWNFALDQPDSPSMLLPRGLAEGRDGRLWLAGAGGGVNRLDLRSGRIERFFEGAEGLPDRRLWSALETADGALWLGHQRGLSRFDPVSGELRTWHPEATEDAPPPGPVDLMIEADSASFWLSAYGGGIERRDLAGRIIQRILPGPSQGLPAADTEQLALGPDGSLWIAGPRGALRWERESERFLRPEGLPDDAMQGLAFDPQGRLWTAAVGELQAWSLEEDRARPLQRIGSRHGLPAVPFGGLLADAAGRLWLGSPRGLVRVDPGTSQVRVFGLRDGLPSIEFSDRPGLRTREGLIAKAAMGALVVFDPDALEAEVDPPALQVERIWLRRGGVQLELASDRPLALRHDDRELHVLARAVSFAEPERLRYRFRLLGYEQDWVEQLGRGERVFSQLPPGRYELQLQASDRLGRWQREPLLLPVVVDPPWWARGESILGFALALAAVAWLLLQLWRRRLAQRHAEALVEQQRRLALEASEAKTAFLQHLGHEVRTPMTGVLGMTELLAGTGLDARQRGYVDAIARSGEVMLRVVNDALDLARIEAGRLPLEATAFEPRRLLEELALPLRAQAERKRIGFRLELTRSAQDWRLGDPLRLRQILLNLGGNAVKFTEHGEVVLRWLDPSEQASFRVEVEDTGPGLDAAQQARLFQRFAQAEGARTAARHGGSGLGLAISRELARLMGGEIALESEPGHGARFRLTLPLPAAAPPGKAQRVAAAAPARSLQLLLVEDDATVAATLTGLLESLGHRVLHAPHALAALAELQSTRFDLVLCDLDLPGMDGLSLARLLRQRGETLPLLAITARADPEAEAGARAAGMQGFLRKPVSAAQLAVALARAVE
jgi:signal transduction histidine kinase/streptogramin lyase